MALKVGLTSAVKNCLVPLKAAYNVAIEDGLVTFNPASKLGRLLKAPGDKRQHIQPLTSEEVKVMLHKAKDYPSLYPVLLCAVRTGLRMGELIGLQWRDIDFNGGFLEVRRAVVMGKETTTKSHKIRRVDMSRQLQEELKRLKEIREMEGMSRPSGGESPWVFLSPEGHRWDERNLRRGWYRCLERAGVREVRFHDMRHTFVSLLIKKGAHPKYIQEQAGHSSIQVTMDTYGHLFPSQNREWVNKLDEPDKAPDEPVSSVYVPGTYPAPNTTTCGA